MNFGYIFPSERTKEQEEFDDLVKSSMPKFSLPFKDDGRYRLWDLAEKGSGGKLKWNWQVSGSCVGAGGGNACKVLMGVEIALGDPEEYKELWWPWTYGQSRRLAGLGGPGEGSFGSAYYKAAKECGFFAAAESPEPLPQFREIGDWVQLGKGDELRWSDGSAFNREPWVSLGRKNLVKGGAVVKSVADALGFVQSGYPLTIASMYGTRTITRQGGSEPVNVARRDDTWAHQMSINEVWKHPSLGWLFRFQNQWGPDAHPDPVSGDPAGGFYVTEREFDQLLRERDTECFALSAFDGFPAREINWYI